MHTFWKSLTLTISGVLISISCLNTELHPVENVDKNWGKTEKYDAGLTLNGERSADNNNNDDANLSMHTDENTGSDSNTSLQNAMDTGSDEFLESGSSTTEEDSELECGFELHVISAYEATDTGGNHQTGRVTIQIERPGSHILVLAAYEPILWTVNAGAKTVIEKVILGGYYPQKVEVSTGTPVESYDYESSNNLTFPTDYTWSLANALGHSEAMVARIEDMTGRKLTTFNGCYSLKRYVLGAELEVDMVCNESEISTYTDPQACTVDGVRPEPPSQEDLELFDVPLPKKSEPWCWTVMPAEGELALLQIDMRNGDWFEVGRYPSPEESIPSSFHTSGMGLLDGSLIMPGYMGNEFQWVELDLEKRLIRVAGRTDFVAGVTSNLDQVVAPCNDASICAYDSFEDLALNRISNELDIGDCNPNSLAIEDDIVYCAWHSLTAIERYSLLEKKTLNTVELEDWDGWVYGISVVGRRIYLLGDEDGENFVRRFGTFDAETGQLLNDFSIDFMGVTFEGTYGLWCDGQPI